MPTRAFLCLFLTVVALTFTAYLPAAAQPDPAPQVIKFGVFPYKSPKTIIKLFSPITKRIEQKLNCKVKLVSAPDFKTYVSRGKKGEYDLAMPCVTCYFAMQATGYSVIAKGEPVFFGGTIVRKDSGIDTLPQLKGKKIASVGKRSFGGHLFLVEQLADLGMNPYKDVEFKFLGKLDSIILGVVNKQYDAGTIRLDALESPMFDAVRDKLKIISGSREIPQFPFVAKNSMPKDAVQKIVEVLTSMTPEDPQDAKILSSLRLRRITSADDSDYSDIRAIFKKLDKLYQ